MPTFTYLQISPITAPDAPTAARVHTDAANTVMQVCYYAPAPCRVVKMLWQCTTTVDTPTIEAVICLGTGTVTGTLTLHIDASDVTIPDNLVAAATIYEKEIPGGYAIAEGTSVVAVLDTAGTGGAPAGAVKIWAVIQPSEI